VISHYMHSRSNTDMMPGSMSSHPRDAQPPSHQDREGKLQVYDIGATDPNAPIAAWATFRRDPTEPPLVEFAPDSRHGRHSNDLLFRQISSASDWEKNGVRTSTHRRREQPGLIRPDLLRQVAREIESPRQLPLPTSASRRVGPAYVPDPVRARVQDLGASGP